MTTNNRTEFANKYAMNVTIDHNPVNVTYGGVYCHVAVMQSTLEIKIPIESFDKLMELDNQREAELKLINSNLTVKAAYEQYQMLVKLCADCN